MWSPCSEQYSCSKEFSCGPPRENKTEEYLIPACSAVHAVVEISVFRQITSNETRRKWLDVWFGTPTGNISKRSASFSTRKDSLEESQVVLVVCCVQIHARAIKRAHSGNSQSDNKLMLKGTVVMVMRKKQVLLFYFPYQIYLVGLVIKPAPLLPEYFFPNSGPLDTHIFNTVCSQGLCV